MTLVVLDYETRSELELRHVGAWRYAEHPSTDVVCLSYSVDGAEPRTWAPGFPAPADLLALVTDGATLEAHNAQFEIAIWTLVSHARYGWPLPRPEQWRCTMAACGYRALPMKLEKAAAVLGLRNQKDMQGNRVGLQLSKPRRPTKANPNRWFGETEGCTSTEAERQLAKWQQTLDYCAQDVRTEVDLGRKLGPLPRREQRVWLLDQEINARGVYVDQELCRAACDVADRVAERESARLQGLTGGAVTSANQVDTIRQYCIDRGVEVPDVTADTVKAALGRDDLPDDVRGVLEVRQRLGKSTAAKYDRALEAVCDDGRLRGLLQYHAAGATGRWGGRIVQPQNMRRPVLKTEMDVLADLVKQRDPDLLEAIYGDTYEVLADAVRGMFVAAPGHKLLAGDFSGVEARILYAMVGQWDKVRVMAAGGDVYADMASQIYKRPVNKHDDPYERDIGKRSVLGLGYGMGVDKFWSEYAPEQPREVCDQIVGVYRREWAPAVPDFWRTLEEAIFGCMADGEPRETYGLRFELHEGWAAIRLHSGRRIWFAEPRIVQREMPWSTPEEPDVRWQASCRRWENGRWVRQALYGGLLCGEVVQATARDLLVRAMFICRRESLPLVLTVHDEVVTEPEVGRGSPDELRQIMEDVPEWAREWPITAECWEGERYRK